MAESLESMEVLLVANVDAMLRQVTIGLQQVRENLARFKGQVELTASVDKLLGTLKVATGSISDWKGQADRAATVEPRVNPGPAISGLGELKRQFQDFGKIFTDWFYYVRAFQQVEGAIRNVIAASDAQEMALARLNQAVANNASATEGMFGRLKAQAEDLAAQFGFLGDEQIESAQAVLVGFGLTEEQVRKLTPALLDMAAGLEKAGGGEQDLENIARLVGKAVQGQGEALVRMGIQIDEARAKTDPFGATVAGLARFQGQAAAMAGTHAGGLKKLQNSLGELQESMGDILKAVLTPLAAALKAVVDAFLWLPQPVQAAVVALVALKVALMATGSTVATNIAGFLLWADAVGTAATAAAIKFFATVSAQSAWTALTSGLSATIASFRALIGTMGAASAAMAGLSIAAVVGYAVGTAIEWVADQTYTLDAAVRQLSEAERAQIRDHMLFTYGVLMSNKEMDLWVQLSPKVRNALAEQARLAGDTRIAIEAMTAAWKEERQTRQQAIANVGEAEFEKTRADAYRKAGLSRIQQINEEAAAQRKVAEDSSKSLEEQNRAKAELTRLAVQLGVEERRAAEEGARKHQDAANRAKEAWTSMVDAANEAFRKFRAQAQEAADRVASEMEMAALKAVNPEGAEVAAAQMLAQKRIADAQYIEDDRRRAETLKQIEEQLGRDIAEIHLRYATEEAQRETARQQKAEADLQKAAQDAKAQMQQIVAGITNPMEGMIQTLLTTLGPAAAAFGQIMGNALQPVSQALTSFLTGAKVKWSSVLQQMAGQFVSMLVSKVIAGVVKMVATWIFGEKAKAAATTAGTAVAVGANAVQQGSNTATAGTGILAAIANIFKAHSSIPFVGVAIAIGFVALMMALFSSMKSKTKAMAVGGLVESPTFALLGEAGREFVAPENDFKEVVASLVASTLDTVRIAAREVVPRAPRTAAAGGGDAGAAAWAGGGVHLHGFALVDSGEREMLARTNRLLGRAASEARGLTSSDGDHVGA